jgi:hypothetical protein
MKVIITESQYKKVLIREFGETESDPKEWYDKILMWVDGDRSKLRFDSNSYETVVYDDKGIYLGYYMDDYTDEGSEEYLEEDEETGGTEGGDAPSGGSSTTWPLTDLARSVANFLGNDPHYTSGPHPFSSPWEDKINRGPSNQLT